MKQKRKIVYDVGLRIREEESYNCVIVTSSSCYEAKALVDLVVVAGTKK